jgi:hypothetical protein
LLSAWLMRSSTLPTTTRTLMLLRRRYILHIQENISTTLCITLSSPSG